MQYRFLIFAVLQGGPEKAAQWHQAHIFQLYSPGGANVRCVIHVFSS